MRNSRSIGAVVVTHGRIGEELVRAALSIVRGSSPLTSVSLEHDQDLDKVRHKIRRAIRRVDRGRGVLLLTDMFGGTPSNLCLPFLSRGRVEVVTGVNLPMLIKFAGPREEKSLGQFARYLKTYGQKNIARAQEVLRKRAP